MGGTNSVNEAQGSSMPFLRILQGQSAEVDPSKPDYAEKHIDGAKAGDVLFSGDHSILDTPIEIVVVSIKDFYVEKVGVKSTGSFVGNHPLTIVSDSRYHRDPVKKYIELLGANRLYYTSMFFVRFRTAANQEWREGIIQFQSTQLRVSRSLGTLIRSVKYPEETAAEGIQPQLFSQSYLLSTRTENNDDGSWFGWAVERGTLFDIEKDQEFLVECFAVREQAMSAPLALEQKKETPALTEDSVSEEPF
jgi:hypothetical protein